MPEKKKLLIRDPRLVSQENLNNAGALRLSDECAEEVTRGIYLWRGRLEEHYERLEEKYTSDSRRRYLLRCVDSAAEFENLPRGSYCRLPSKDLHFSKGEAVEYLAEVSGCSKGWFGNTAFDGRKRPSLETVKTFMHAVKPGSEEEFLNVFGWSESLESDSEEERVTNIRKDLTEHSKKRWPELSWSGMGAYLGLSGGTMDNVKIKRHMSQGTCYRFIISFGELLSGDKLTELYHKLGLHPLAGGEADGVAEASMQGFGEITARMTGQPGIYELETACLEYWALLKAMLTHYDKFSSHKLRGLIFDQPSELVGESVLLKSPEGQKG